VINFADFMNGLMERIQALPEKDQEDLPEVLFLVSRYVGLDDGRQKLMDLVSRVFDMVDELAEGLVDDDKESN
jgi:hypothetical protein